MGSGSSAARKSRGQQSTADAPRSRRPSPGSSSSDPCDPCCTSRGDVWQQGDPTPATTLPFPESVRSTTEDDEEEDDTDGELDKALAESQDVYDPLFQHETSSGSRPPRAGTPAPGSSSMLIPSMELEGTRTSNAHGWTLQDRALRETKLAGWAQGNGNRQSGDNSTELFNGCTQDAENNNMPIKFQTKCDVISDSQDPILYDMSEEELMASIEREY